MTLRAVPAAAAAACVCGALSMAPPTPAAMGEFGASFARPLLLPFAWEALDEATARGDSGEVFASAHHLMRLLPAWSDGHAVFAYRYALDAEALPAAEGRARAALRRLQTALAWLQAARPTAGRREIELLQAMAFLPEVAIVQEPSLEELLRPGGGATALGDRYLDEAEKLGADQAVREQRTFLAPRLAAGFLAAGDTRKALIVLDTAIERSAEVRDRELANEWRTRLDEARRWLRGDHGVDLAPLRSDRRFAALVPHLR